MPKIIKTTDQHFEIFRKEFIRWIPLLGLQGWELYFLHENIKGNHRANIANDIKAKYAIIRFGKKWDCDIIGPTINEIKRVAFHEAWHLKLAHFKGRDEDYHDIIYTIERLVKKWEARKVKRKNPKSGTRVMERTV